MLKIYLWGAGKIAYSILDDIEENVGMWIPNNVFDIEAIIDLDERKISSKVHGYDVISPQDAIVNKFDYIVITNADYEGTVNIAIREYGIDINKLKPGYFLLRMLLIAKYQGTSDSEIKETINYLKTQELSFFNNFIGDTSYREPVYWDQKEHLPYVFYVDCLGITRKMYYPRDYQFEQRDGVTVVNTLLYEQYPESPHLYCYKNHEVRKGDAIIDAGVCEGNFALKYASIASNIFLFEGDEQWEEPYYYSFREFNDRVHYFKKYLDREDGVNTITIDSALNKKRVDFIKMDIEGYEVRALEGAQDVLKRNEVKASICAYHKSDDERKIIVALEKQGFFTRTSNGVVFYIWDENIWKTLDFRKCMVYAQKGGV